MFTKFIHLVAYNSTSFFLELLEVHSITEWKNPEYFHIPPLSPHSFLYYYLALMRYICYNRTNIDALFSTRAHSLHWGSL